MGWDQPVVAIIQARTTAPPSTRTGISVSGRVAGPVLTEPSVARNWLPWLGQVMTPAWGGLMIVPWCVHVGSYALIMPALGCTISTFPWGPSTRVPPPTGTADTFASSFPAELAPPVVPRGALVVELLYWLSPPQAASAPGASKPTKRPQSTCRRDG